MLTLYVVYAPPNLEMNLKIGLKSEQEKTQNFLGGIVLQPRLNGILTGRNRMKQVRDKQKVKKWTGNNLPRVRVSRQNKEDSFPQEFHMQDEKWKR